MKFSGRNPIKKHETLEDSVEDYADTIKQLGKTDSHFVAGGHFKSEAMETRNGQAEEFPVRTKDPTAECHATLDDALKLLMLNGLQSRRVSLNLISLAKTLNMLHW